MIETIFDLNADLRILPFSRLAFRLKVAMGNIKKGFDTFFLQKEVVESIGNLAGIGQGTGFGLRERDRDGIGLGHYRLRTSHNS